MSDIFQQVKQHASLTEYAQAHLQKAAAGGEFVCPNCGSGGHGNRGSDSAFHIDENKGGFYCHACDFNGDIFNLCAHIEHLEPQSRETLERVAEFAGVAIDEGASHLHGKQTNRKAAKTRETVTAEMLQAREQSRAYIEGAKSHLTDAEPLAYIQARGYTVERLQSIGAGYDPKIKRLILPYMGANYYYIARDITGTPAGGKYQKVPKFARRLGAEPLYNGGIVKNAPCLFIVEGVFDMLALKTLDVENVIPLCGNGAASSHLLNEIDKLENAPCVCLALDKDETGEKTQRELREKLERRGVACVDIDTSHITGKDADEMRANDPQALKAAFEGAGAYAVEHKEEIITEQNMKALKSEGLKNSFETLKELETLANEPKTISSGIPELDALLWGGFEPSLIVLGATSSTGKTTLITQMADYMAENENPVLFVSIEQSAEELTAKSLSRISLERVGVDTRNYQDAITPNQIRHKQARADMWKEEKHHLFAECLEHYRQKIAPYMYYFASNEQPNMQQVKAAVKTLAAYHSRPPVVFVDYLQLLAAQSERDTDKQAVDKNVSALRRLARDFETPVIVISSLNRGSYSGVVSMEAFKESGAIEYSADILLGLQPSNLEGAIELANGNEKKEKQRAKQSYKEFRQKQTREITLTVLKNRNGAMPEKDGFEFTFHAMFSKLQPHT